MKNKIYIVSVMSLFFLSGKMYASPELNAEVPAEIAKRMVAASDNKARAESMQALQQQYYATKLILLHNLYDAQEKYQGNKACFSPLHIAIMSIGIWQISSADDALLEMIDYTVDPASLPDGMNVAGDFFYPSIRVLVNLRVDSSKVINAIVKAQDNTQICLLTWVLNERQGDNFEKSISLLTMAIDKDDKSIGNNNLSEAINLLKNTKHSADLIPFPIKISKQDK